MHQVHEGVVGLRFGGQFAERTLARLDAVERDAHVLHQIAGISLKQLVLRHRAVHGGVAGVRLARLDLQHLAAHQAVAFDVHHGVGPHQPPVFAPQQQAQHHRLLVRSGGRTATTSPASMPLRRTRVPTSTPRISGSRPGRGRRRRRTSRGRRSGTGRRTPSARPAQDDDAQQQRPQRRQGTRHG